MTVISDTFRDIAGYGDSPALTFWAPVLEDRPVEEYILTERITHVAVAADGSFTTPDFAPGSARVRIGGRSGGRIRVIDIPDWPTAVRLGPLLAASEEVPAEEMPTAVRNLGGMPGLLLIEPEDFDALSAIDPDTTYFIPD